MPGAVQGWMPEDSIESKGTVTVENVVGHSATGSRSLALRYRGVATGRPARAATATFIPQEAAKMGGYGLIASPTLYPGQTVRAGSRRIATTRRRCCAVSTCKPTARTTRWSAPTGRKSCWNLASRTTLCGRSASTGGEPIAEIGVELSSDVHGQTARSTWII